MAKISYNPSASLNMRGITPAAGPGSTLTNLQSFNGTARAADDQHSRSFIVNAATVDAVVNMGPIATGKIIMIEVDAPISIKITQDFGAGPVENSILIGKFLMLESDFTVVKVSNSGGDAVNMMISIVGDRVAVGGGGGLF